MSYRTTTRALLVTALAAAPPFLTGCEPAEITDNSSQTGTVQCDPNGFGPLSGCDGVDDNTGEDTFQDCHTLVVGCKGDHPENLQPEPLGQPPVPSDPAPASCPQDWEVTVTYGDNGDVVKVERLTYDGTPENPTNVQAHPIQVSRKCLQDLNQESHDFTTWLNDELDQRGAR